MNCKRIEEILMTDYLDGNLAGEELRSAEEHLASCEGCRKIVDALESAGRAFKEIKKEEPPPEVWNNIVGRITAERAWPVTARRVFTSFRFQFPSLRAGAFAMAGVAALILFVLLTARLMPGIGMRLPGAAQDDIVAISYSDTDWDEGEYGFETPVEEYFL